MGRVRGDTSGGRCLASSRDQRKTRRGAGGLEALKGRPRPAPPRAGGKVSPHATHAISNGVTLSPALDDPGSLFGHPHGDFPNAPARLDGVAHVLAREFALDSEEVLCRPALRKPA